ncbi:ABC transporter,membrane component, glycine betaine/proline family [Prochlorococcus marinus str. MIT 9313]|uniref:ABC transporter,membrane component, glycine betaine/proline family n=1 Tax=Prochlorococcus marinus (strain MIT 9313) TaxID=74547 RepID=Q7V820_PROMM|nr:ABC transporter permease subunit [Prochlorococcus marinus]MCH2566283.1 ABC transporter permease subunit [Prochlorococcus sp. ALOHA_A2.0_51]MEC7383051.1 ABC transporter permease subunit [Cyanobacteriota bacterium]CAE20729.1 ABC transporter,membrane component, glycine betaine/proline family [Prochlorococcus marinus str. MIT 9313]|tara:strand:+ start:1598 stop:2512 length:915 start_codon:yes stop_codon:yes gene_type:complete
MMDVNDQVFATVSTGPVGEGMSRFVDWLLNHAQPIFLVIDSAINGLAGAIEQILSVPAPWLLAPLIAILAAWRVSFSFAILSLLGLNLVLFMGLWPPMISTLALVIAASLLALIIGIPIGIFSARRQHIWAITRPVLDLMQTMPAFVYLIPAVMFFGTGLVPSTIATLIFSMPPVVRLTYLGIRQVPVDLIEAGRAFGCSERQLLWKVQLPNALPTLMAGVNQTIMLALSMVVIASMIGGGGLGDVVLRGIQQLDVGLGFEGGLAVVILAVILDRLTQSLAASNFSRKSLPQRFKAFINLWTSS